MNRNWYKFFVGVSKLQEKFMLVHTDLSRKMSKSIFECRESDGNSRKVNRKIKNEKGKENIRTRNLDVVDDYNWNRAKRLAMNKS